MTPRGRRSGRCRALRRLPSTIPGDVGTRAVHMLPRAHRLRRPREFREAVRSGARAGSSTVVGHAALRDQPGPEPAQIGFVVSKAVGPAVVRNRVKRRLRHLCAARIDRLPHGTRLVIRALPPAGAADLPELAADLDAVIDRVLERSDRLTSAVLS